MANGNTGQERSARQRGARARAAPRGASASWLRQPQPDATKGLGSGDWLANRCGPYLLPFWLKTNDKPGRDWLANPLRPYVPPCVLIYSRRRNEFRNRLGAVSSLGAGEP